MIRIVALFMLCAAAAQAQVAVPSGQPLEVYSLEVVPQSDADSLLFIGLLAPELQQSGYDLAVLDMDVLCVNTGLPEAAKQVANGITIGEVTIRLANQPLAYGHSDPQVIQFMSFYDISTGECTWH